VTGLDELGERRLERISVRSRSVRQRLGELAGPAGELSRELGALHLELAAACAPLDDRTAAQCYRDSGMAEVDGQVEELAHLLLLAVSAAP